MTLLRIDNLSKAFAGVPVLDHVSWQIEASRTIGLIGANGSGKSTLLHLLAGALEPDTGTIERARGLRIGHLTQTTVVEGDRTLYHEVQEAFRPLLDMQTEMATLEARMAQQQASEPELQRYGTLLEEFNTRQGYALAARIEATLSGLGFGPDTWHKPVRQLSGGQKNMGALAKVLLQEPDLLLLDEPSNHLDITATEWLEGVMQDYTGTVIVVSHDRYLLDRTVEEIVELERQQLVRYPGNYSAYVNAKAARLEQQRKAYEQQQAEIQRQEDFIRRNIAGQKTRQAQSRRKALERLERLDTPPTSQPQMILQPTTAGRESHEVVVCREVCKAYGQHQVLRGLSCTVYRGDKVGLMGPNGAGKSTLLRLLLGHEAADRGTVRLGRNVEAVYYDQELRDLHPDHTVLDEVWQVEPWQTVGAMRSYLGRFLFSGDEVLQKVGSLSGGEKSRVALAKLLLAPANLLILDEPTNHLDIPAREALERALSSYAGTLLVVSHDRYFLDQIITRLLYIHDGTCDAYPGTYSAYQAHLAARSAPPSPPRPQSKPPPGRNDTRRSRPVRRRKLSTIEADITRLEAELATLQAAVEARQDSSDWQQLVELTTQQGEVAARLDQLMQEWEDAMAAQGGG